MNIARTLLIITATIFLSACGGGGSSTTDSDVKTGQFKDSVVKGLNYETATQSGVTDEYGTFKYKAGETVTFKIGAMGIGSAEGADILYPKHIAESDSEAIKIAQVLQTLDKDSDPDNEGIDITDQFNNNETGTQDITQANDLQDLINEISTTSRTLVNADQAKKHMDATIFADTYSTFESVSNQDDIASRISIDNGRLKISPQYLENVWLLAKSPTEITSLSADVEFVPEAQLKDLGLTLELNDGLSKAVYFRIVIAYTDSTCSPDSEVCTDLHVNRIEVNNLYSGELLSKKYPPWLKNDAPYTKQTLNKNYALYYDEDLIYTPPPLSDLFRANFTIAFDKTAKKVIVKHGDKQSYFDASGLFSDFSQVQAKFFIKTQDLDNTDTDTDSDKSAFVDNVKINNLDFDDFSSPTLDTTKWKTGKFSYIGK